MMPGSMWHSYPSEAVMMSHSTLSEYSRSCVLFESWDAAMIKTVYVSDAKRGMIWVIVEGERVEKR